MKYISLITLTFIFSAPIFASSDLQSLADSATEFDKSVAFELVNKIPEKSKFETFEDYLPRYLESIPEGWYVVNIDFDSDDYEPKNKRFFNMTGELAEFVSRESLGFSDGQNSFGAEMRFETIKNEVVRIFLQRNIKEKSIYEKYGIEQDYTLMSIITNGYATLEPVEFVILPQEAEALKNAKLYFKINTLFKGASTNQATLNSPVQEVHSVANIGLSADSFILIDGSFYGFKQADVASEYSSDRGLSVTKL